MVAVGPGGAWGQALALDALAAHLRGAARVYAEVERGVAGVLAAVAAGADLAARGGWLADGPASEDGRGLAPRVEVRGVPTTLDGPLAPTSSGPGRVPGLADLVAAGEGLDGGRVRVLETSRPGGGSAWVVVVPGTQEWSPRAGPNPFDLTTDVRALAGEATLAAAGVAAALTLARSRSGRATADDPVLLVGHSQGGILAAALASDPASRVSTASPTSSPPARRSGCSRCRPGCGCCRSSTPTTPCRGSTSPPTPPTRRGSPSRPPRRRGRSTSTATGSTATSRRSGSSRVRREARSRASTAGRRPPAPSSAHRSARCPRWSSSGVVRGGEVFRQQT